MEITLKLTTAVIGGFAVGYAVGYYIVDIELGAEIHQIIIFLKDLCMLIDYIYTNFCAFYTRISS